MPYLFHRLAAVTDLLSCGSFGLIVDIDGTIAPIAPSPELAGVTPACRRYLRSLSRSLPLVAAVSGRPVLDAKRLVRVPSLVYVGNHGLERWENGRVVVDPAVARFRRYIKEALSYLTATLHESGVRIEDKGVTMSVHYRLAADQEPGRQLVLEAAARVSARLGLRVTEGRMVVEIRPPVNSDKGSAVMRLVEAHGIRSAVYLGDDVTDIDAFSALRSWREAGKGGSISVAVLSPESEDALAAGADAYVHGVGDVERFLAWLSGEAPKQASTDPPTGGRAT